MATIKYEINDLRFPKDFKGISFSKHKKTEVKTALTQALLKAKVEPACYWAAELICAGHYGDLWEIILHYVGKHIHLGNPKLAIYLHMRYEMFESIVSSGTYLSELHLRNNEKMRKLFAEIIAMIALSNKKNSFEPIRINRIEEFDITQMTERLKAPSLEYIQDVFRPEDPKELVIAVNEFAYHISADRTNSAFACYWIEWIIDFDIICKKRKEPVRADRRSKTPVAGKFQSDIIWIFWDALHVRVKHLQNEFISKVMDALYKLFCIKYTTGACKKRRYLLYYAVALVTEPVPTSMELISAKETVQAVIANIDDIYKQIKKNEEAPKTDYLFSNLDRQFALEKSARKMELMDSLNMIPRNGP
jgi:hypothetical protein